MKNTTLKALEENRGEHLYETRRRKGLTPKEQVIREEIEQTTFKPKFCLFKVTN